MWSKRGQSIKRKPGQSTARVQSSKYKPRQTTPRIQSTHRASNPRIQELQRRQLAKNIVTANRRKSVNRTKSATRIESENSTTSKNTTTSENSTQANIKEELKKEQNRQLEIQRLKEELEKRGLEKAMLKKRHKNGESELDEILAKIESIYKENIRRAEEKKRIEAEILNGQERRTINPSIQHSQFGLKLKPEDTFRFTGNTGWNMQEMMRKMH
jgi:hypothetical protein